MTAEEMIGWQEFFRVEPWGGPVEDYRAAITASVVANVYRDKKKRDKPFGPEDFMPQHAPKEGEERKRKTPEEMLRAVEAITLAMGGKDLRPEWKKKLHRGD